MNEMPRKRVFCTLHEDIVEWIDQEIEKARFRNRSHAIEYALVKLMQKEK